MASLKDIFRKVNKDKALKKGIPLSETKEKSAYKVLICGIPNVGKSSFINSARKHFMAKGGKATPVGKKPGVTRSVMQSVIISRKPIIKILDTPGIVPPNVKDPLLGIKLAVTGTFPDHVIGEEVIADYLLFSLNRLDNKRYLKFCGLDSPSDDFDHVIEAIAKKEDLLRNGEPDYRKCSNKMISAFREGKFGAITLDEI